VKNKIAVFLCIAAALSGCQTLDQVNQGKVDKTGAYPLSQRIEVEELDLAHVIVEHANLDRSYNGRCRLSERSETLLQKGDESLVGGKRLDQALGCFAEYAERRADRAKDLRNQIQARMFSASEQRCSDFKMHLQRSQSFNSYLSGVFTAAFAAAGSITKSVEGARTLAGLSGFSSATGAEFNQAYFANLAAHVVVAGIDRQRARIYEQVYSHGHGLSITEYTLQAAIRDGFRYHGACALTSGLIEAQDSIRLAESPGLEQLARAITRNKHLQAINQATPDDVPSVLEKWKTLLPPDRWLAGVPLVASSRPALDEAARAANAQSRLVTESSTAKDLVDSEYVKLTKSKPVLMKDGSILQVTAAALKNASSKGLDAVVGRLNGCSNKVLSQATTQVDLASKRAVAKAGVARDKVDIDVKYANAEQNELLAEMNRAGAIGQACAAEVTRRLAEIASTAEDANDRTIATLNEKLKAIPKYCVDAAALPALAACN
jgi:hypothetical protein